VRLDGLLAHAPQLQPPEPAELAAAERPQRARLATGGGFIPTPLRTFR
jgi:hypothetical protein